MIALRPYDFHFCQNQVFPENKVVYNGVYLERNGLKKSNILRNQITCFEPTLIQDLPKLLDLSRL